MSARSARVRARLLESARRGLVRLEPRETLEVEEWALPPDRLPARPEVRAVVAAGARLTRGLAREWSQVELPAPAGAVDPADLDEADLVLVELLDGVVPGHATADVDLLLERADHHGVPLVVWATHGGPPEHFAHLVAAAPAVFVADAGQVDAWKQVADVVHVLPAGVSLRRHGVPAPQRRGASIVVEGPVDASIAGAVATHLVAAVRHLEDIEVTRTDETAPISRVLRTRVVPTVPDPSAGVAVHIDAARTRAADAAQLLEAGALRTPVVTLGELPIPPDLEDVVLRGADKTGLRSEIVAMLAQPELRERQALRLHRAVHAGHGLGDRVARLLTATGIADPGTVDRSVSAVVPTNRPHELDNVLANLGRQAHTDLELVLVLHGIDIDRADLHARARQAGVPRVAIVEAPQTATLGACMNLGVEAAEGAFVVKMDDDNHYGTHFLTDLLDARESSGAGIVGKWAHYVWLRSTGAVVLRYPEAEHTYARRIQGGSMLFDGDLVRELRFSDVPRAVDSTILDRAIEDGVRIWSADRFNFVSVRGTNRHAHTWTVEDASFMTAAGRLEFYGDPRRHVEV